MITFDIDKSLIMKKILFIFVSWSSIFMGVCFAQDAAVDRINAGQLAFNKFTYPYNILFEEKLRNFNPDLFKPNKSGEFVLDFKNFKGSPYEVNSFLFGFVTDEQSNKSVNLYLRYNIYNDEVELKTSLEEDEKIIALLKEQDISCTIDGKYYQFASFNDEKNEAINGYLIQIYEGKNYQLFKRLKSAFTPKKASENSFNQAIPARFETSVSYYIKQGDSTSYLPEKKKLLLAKFSNQNNLVKNYLSNKSTTLKDVNDFIGLIKLLDSSN